MYTQKTTLGVFVGGLGEEMDDKLLYAAFIPFGDITGIQILLDYETHQGFAFAESELAEGSNFPWLNESELFGQTIRVTLAKPERVKEGSSRPVWSNDDCKEVEGSEPPKLETQERISAATRRALASRAAASTTSSPSSCARTVISPTTTALGASPSTGRSLTMKTLSSNTRDQVGSDWWMKIGGLGWGRMAVQGW
uniref:RRM domain-containing protein n=1 Tax=Moschus moschiferus TaxID=68415 RepID=A0A8C6FI23_MOSMO